MREVENMNCWKCKLEINKNTKKCPKCGASQYILAKKILFIIAILFVLIILIAILIPKDSNLKILYGDLVEFKEICKEYNSHNDCLNNIAIIEAKIKPSYNNQTTIDQNYYNIVDLIKNNNFNNYNEIQYWAIMNLNNDSDVKVISFTVPKDIIQKIYNNEISDKNLSTYITDLYIHPSLQN